MWILLASIANLIVAICLFVLVRRAEKTATLTLAACDAMEATVKEAEDNKNEFIGFTVLVAKAGQYLELPPELMRLANDLLRKHHIVAEVSVVPLPADSDTLH